MYAWATRLLGYKVGRHEGKLTGLASYGDTSHVKQLGGQLLQYTTDSKSFLNPYLHDGNYISFTDKLRCLLNNEAVYPSYEAFRRLVGKYYGKNFRPEDIAAIAQIELERAVTAWVSDLVNKTGLTHVALAGGIFANVKLNQQIEAIPETKKVWIFPDMGDGGLSVGAAYLQLNSQKTISSRPLENVYLGPKFNGDQILAACKDANLHVTKQAENLAQETAKLLADGVIVGWFQGRMEFGPRALGHRSILLHPGRREMNQVINKRLNRTEFMPFAPSVLEEYKNDLFSGGGKSEHASQFMTITYDVNPEWIDRLAAVVHIDNTARPQVVYKGKETLYWSVIDEFRKLTGLPAIVNTSFNMHEEPIVCTPEDAIRSYLHGAVDVLVLGDYIVRKGSGDF